MPVQLLLTYIYTAPVFMYDTGYMKKKIRYLWCRRWFFSSLTTEKNSGATFYEHNNVL